MTDTQQLLRAYVQEHSESAFRELVAQYVNLVFSAAMRLTNDNAHFAEDISQAVFIELARKAKTLSPEVQLGGWLYRTTCFTASTMRRGEQRRIAREQQAVEMKTLHDDSESNWHQLAPILDDAVQRLGEEDRQAIILRFFEKRDFRSVGIALGVSNDAAQKRVSRALEKLRSIFATQGLAITIGTVTGLLLTRSISAAPVHLKNAATTAALAAVMDPPSTGPLKFVVAGATLMVLLVTFSVQRGLLDKLRPRSSSVLQTRVETNGTSSVGAEAMSGETDFSQSANAQRQSAETSLSDIGGSKYLHLEIVAADSGRRVANVPLDIRGNGSKPKLVSNRLGVCNVPIPPEGGSLELITRLDGFADTRLFWQPKRGEVIPTNYTLRLVRPVPIGGQVVDSEGRPVAGATVGWNHEADHTPATPPESHDFAYIEVETDADGHWEMSRIAPEMIRRLYGSATHSNFVRSGSSYVSQSSGAEAELLEKRHQFRLGRAFDVTGTIVDSQGQPVSEASILIGPRNTSERRTARSINDGRFTARGVTPGENFLAVQAEGFAPTTQKVDVSATLGPLTIQMNAGKVLRLKTVDEQGGPVPNAQVTVAVYGDDNGATTQRGLASLYKKLTNDVAGYAIWTNAPDELVVCRASAKNYMGDARITVRPDNEEHVITLAQALTIDGTVSDEKGKPIPRFRIVCGWVDEKGTVNWSNLDRFWLNFGEGHFDYTFNEGVAIGVPLYAFQFEASGYETVVSRIVNRNEKHATLNVLLKKTAASTDVTVLLPNGRPAAGADVAVAGIDNSFPPKSLSLGTSGFNRIYSNGKILHADAKGICRLSFDPDAVLVIAVNSQGYAESTPMILENDSVIRLQPWGRIEGIYRKNGQPVAGQKLQLGHGIGAFYSLSFNYSDFIATTDAEGKFTFPRVPPGNHRLSRVLGAGEFNASTFDLRHIDVLSAEPTRIEVDDDGYKLKARLQWPNDAHRGANTFVTIRFHSPYAKPPAGIEKMVAENARWRQAPEVQAKMRETFNLFSEAQSDDLMIGEGFLPGSYVLEVSVAKAIDESGKPIHLHAEQTVTIPSDSVGGALDLGNIELRPWEK